MPAGLILTIPEEDIEREQIADFIQDILHRVIELQFSHYNEDGPFTTVYVLKLKLWRSNDAWELSRRYPGKYWPKVVEEVSFCEERECYQKVAALQYEALSTTCLHNRHGETIHELYERCAHHVARSSHALAKRVEVVNLTPNEKQYWEHVALWRFQNWYSQHIEMYQDGDYESGYFDCLSASPWLGPFATRDEALAAGQDYQI